MGTALEYGRHSTDENELDTVGRSTRSSGRYLVLSTRDVLHAHDAQRGPNLGGNWLRSDESFERRERKETTDLRKISQSPSIAVPPGLP